ncbi:hypothetical protein DASC09_006110 [Saccharomycopsis crataegensis]|uniref:aromatic-amino-acid transaminase n=1 Tax=Saccharomycopsis crataegensis TaxID=43959 RepID=A0AAV5QFA9_9ASCO|nr:hypothetical protein DASC09_006110 [Saccharomycopsis crataegensis]
MPLDLSHLFSTEVKARSPSKLKTIASHRATPDIAFLGGGLPLPSYFAWDTLSATTRKPPFEGGLPASVTASNELSFTVTKESDELDIPLSKALQYGTPKGPTQLLDYLVEHTNKIHSIPYNDWEIITTVGSTQSWDSCIRVFCDPGDTILVEKYAFTSALETAVPQGVTTLTMEMDDSGIIPEMLEEKLAKIKSSGAKLPKLIYTVPTGQNPTGSSMPFERRKAVYDIASKYDIIIIEDEPYYFLQLDQYVKASERTKPTHVSSEEFIKSLVPSFLNLDVDGRVVRLDSFSKVLAPGSRLGWMTGQTAILERFLRVHETSIQTPSGFSSAMVYGTLARWGQDGFLDWLQALRHEYTYKRDSAIDSALKHVPSVAEVHIPIAGMFFTISFDTTKHPEFKTKYNSDPLALEKDIYETTIQKNALLVPGSWFEVLEEGEKPSTNIFFRATYAATNVEVLDKGLERFGAAIKQVWGL